MNLASYITRTFERFGLRGAPTLLRLLSNLLPKSVTSVTLQSGQQIHFRTFDPYWCRYLYAGVPYEPDVEAILRKFAFGRILIDCGANIGYWSVRSKELGFTAAIAIEANADHIPLLKQNVSNFLWAAVHSRSNENLFLAGDGAVGHLADTGVPVSSIALADLGVMQDCVIKLDVEGWEIPAIQGAKGMNAIFVYEDWPRDGMPVTEYLLKEGYKVYACDETAIHSPADAINFNRRTTTNYGPSNFYALPQVVNLED